MQHFDLLNLEMYCKTESNISLFLGQLDCSLNFLCQVSATSSVGSCSH